jgi:hypothetical protein
MFRRSSIAVALLLASCGGAEPHEDTTPVDDTPLSCPSEASPEHCRALADAAASAGNTRLAWAYTVLECESPAAAQCTTMWQQYAKLAPTQTDALNVLHTACNHSTAACEQLATWHTERGHVLAAAAYHKRAAMLAPAGSSLAADLAAIMHLSGAAPRTDAIAQAVGHELRAPKARATTATLAKPVRKAWPMHAAPAGSTSDACPTTALLDRHQEPLAKCISEVRPFDDDQIAVRNRCSQAVNVTYAGARADHTTFTKQVRLEPYEALSAGISHTELGPLTYAVCPGDCRVTRTPDDVTASWTGNDERYYCTRGSGP